MYTRYGYSACNALDSLRPDKEIDPDLDCDVFVAFWEPNRGYTMQIRFSQLLTLLEPFKASQKPWHKSLQINFGSFNPDFPQCHAADTAIRMSIDVFKLDNESIRLIRNEYNLHMEERTLGNIAQLCCWKILLILADTIMGNGNPQVLFLGCKA